MPTSSSDPLAGIRSKIEWTKKHVADLDQAIRAFLDSGPYKVGVKRDPDTRKLIYYVGHVDGVPDDIPQIAGDAIGNMVSILDHLAYRLFLKSNPGVDGRHIYFPISKNAKTLTKHKSDCQRKVQGIDAGVVAALDALEPYQGGKGHQLWVLNELNNLAKHRDLIAVGSRFRNLDLGAHVIASLEKLIGSSLPPSPAFFKADDPLCPLKVGDELFVGAPDEEPNDKMQFTFDVALNEPQIIQAEPLIETIHQLLGLVDGIVGQFTPFL